MTAGAHESIRSPLDGIFYPRSIAVLGVVATPNTVPNDIFRNILTSGFQGVLYPVAPGKRSIYSVRAYRYVLDIEDDVDQAVIVYPANVCKRAMEQVAEKGIRSVIMISAGFREVGPKGIAREQEIKDICAANDIALIGPNCLGVINTDPAVNLNASFARKMPAPGRIAFLSQSGALCTAVLDYARGKNIGFSKFVSFGNKAGVTEIGLLDYLHDDPETDVILLYLEELRDARGLIEMARHITRGDNPKPILAIKSGRTPEGANAAASHTGSLAGEDAICDAVFRQAGIIRLNTIEEMFNAAVMLTDQPMPHGNRLAIVTNAGGPGVMATDTAVGVGLTIPTFTDETAEKLKASLPAAANMKNPVDVIGDARADRYAAALDAVLADPSVDQALVILTPQSMTDIETIAHAVVDVHERTDKPLAASFMGAADVAPGIEILNAAHIPHYILPELACKAMADVQRVRRWRERPATEFEPLPVDREAAAAIVDAAPAGYLPEHEALAVLKAYGMPVPEYKLCRSADEAAEYSEQIGYPIVMRVASPQVVHKFDVGGVALGMASAEEVRDTYEQIADRVTAAVPGAHIEGMVVRRLIPDGHEVILGAKRDAVFGPTVMFGLGGIFVEVYKDVNFALAPVDAATVSQMIRGVRTFPLLDGARGTAKADVATIEDSLHRLGQLVSDIDRIKELDINPLIVADEGHGSTVADVRIGLS